MPLVDEKSVMGITMNYNKNISAAHWEDDDDCSDTADDIINGAEYYIGPTGRRRANKERVPLSISNQNIIYAYNNLYDYDSSDLNEIRFQAKDIYETEVGDIINSYNEKVGSSKKAGISKLLLALTSIFNEFIQYCSEVGIDFEDIESSSFLIYFKKKLKENNIKISIDIEDVVHLGLGDICIYDKNWGSVNIFKLLDEVYNEYVERNKDKIIPILSFFMENGYDIKRFFNLKDDNEYINLLVSEGILKFSDYYKFIYDNNILEENIGWILENDFNHITSTNDLGGMSIKFMIKKGLIDKYKDKLMVLINTGKFNNHTCDYIAHEVDDTDISIAAARRILPPKLLKKFKFEISKLEHLKGFEEFKRLL